MMKTLTGLVMILFFSPLCARAQDDDDWPSLSYLRSDYRAVVAVAHVEVSKAEIVGRVGGYENWRVSSKVIEPLKGRLKKGGDLEYYVGAEAGFRPESFTGQRLVFLLFEYDRTRKARVYTVLENSTLPYTSKRVQKLRLIKRSSLRKRSPASGKRTSILPAAKQLDS